MRRLYFWSKDGNFIGVIQVKDLLGTDYPWLEDMQLMEDGSVLLALTQEREDESADELMLFRLTGFELWDRGRHTGQRPGASKTRCFCGWFAHSPEKIISFNKFFRTSG